MKAVDADDVARIDREHGYEDHVHALQATVDTVSLYCGDGPVFMTNAEGLFERYLEALPEADRQYHTCHACRRFVEAYGGLVAINAEGEALPLLWQPGVGHGSFYAPAVASLYEAVRKARVSGVFLSRHGLWGEPRTGPWTHLSVTRSAQFWQSTLQTAEQAMAGKREDYRQVQRALAEFPLTVVREAVRVLESDALYRAEKVRGPALWLRLLHEQIAETQNSRHRENLVWRAVAMAPAGFCHPRSAMIGTLLEDIAAGKSFAEVSAAFAAKMRPDRYQRPQAAPAAGNIAQAEAVVEKLGIARSLERRFARVEEIEAIWRPAEVRPAEADGAGGVFGHLRAKEVAPAPKVDLPGMAITWSRFRREVLPRAERMEAYVPLCHANFLALTTAVHADAPPILQWDRPERRNPVSHYVYMGGSSAARWGLVPGMRNLVTAVAMNPAHGHFDEELKASHHPAYALFVLSGAKDGGAPGLALFPENLRSELHGIRSTIEAFSRMGTLAGVEEASACGLAFTDGKCDPVTVFVHAEGGVREYRIDRWD